LIKQLLITILFKLLGPKMLRWDLNLNLSASFLTLQSELNLFFGLFFFLL